MMTLRRALTKRRLLAGVLLAGLVLSYGIPLRARGAATECPAAPATGHRAPVLMPGMDGGACEHTDAAPCVSTLGCSASAPAVRSLGLALVVPAKLIVFGAPPAPHFGDLYRTGPPTPPPNQI
ncbi:MAG TPA: hypothetical protein VMR92_04570 [Gemmatimonadales bacterium]|nr:hypothetical protein [Gemmatimonadales bacterium]